MDLQVSERPRPTSTCAFCRSDGATAECGCGATFHLTCRTELGRGRCPTLGCAEGPPARTPGTTPWAQVEARGVAPSRRRELLEEWTSWPAVLFYTVVVAAIAWVWGYQVAAAPYGWGSEGVTRLAMAEGQRWAFRVAWVLPLLKVLLDLVWRRPPTS